MWEKKIHSGLCADSLIFPWQHILSGYDKTILTKEKLTMHWVYLINRPPLILMVGPLHFYFLILPKKAQTLLLVQVLKSFLMRQYCVKLRKTHNVKSNIPYQQTTNFSYLFSMVINSYTHTHTYKFFHVNRWHSLSLIIFLSRCPFSSSQCGLSGQPDIGDVGVALTTWHWTPRRLVV